MGQTIRIARVWRECWAESSSEGMNFSLPLFLWAKYWRERRM